MTSQWVFLFIFNTYDQFYTLKEYLWEHIVVQTFNDLYKMAPAKIIILSLLHFNSHKTINVNGVVTEKSLDD